MSEFISDMISECLQRIMNKILFLLSLRSILISYNLGSKKVNFVLKQVWKKSCIFGSKNLYEPCNHIFLAALSAFQ